MADYSTIKGFTIQSLTSDPYASLAASGTWASSNPLNTARYAGASAGTITAGLVAGGYATAQVAVCETYDGTSWTEAGNLPAAKDGMMQGVGGISTAAISCGGASPSAPNSQANTWNGTSWTATSALNTGRNQGNICGIITAMLAFSGDSSADQVELYNGTSWSEQNDVNTARAYGAGFGTSTAAIIAGGSPNTAIVESYDGTSWTETTDLLVATGYNAGVGTQTDGLSFGGTGGGTSTANTEAWNGSVWTEVANLGSASTTRAPGGTSTAAFAAGVKDPSTSGATEEWTTASPVSLAQEGQVWYNDTTNVLKGFGTQGTGAWASGGTVPGYYYGGSLGGTQTAAVVAGGNPGQTTLSFEYDGTSWSATNPLNQGRMYTVCAGFGPQTASQVAGGETTVYLNNSEQYDGTSWSAVNPMINSLQSRSIGGTQAGAIAISGHPGPTTAVEDWDGTSFSAGTASPEGRGYGMGGGTQTSAISCGGTSGIATADVWNGSAWTEIADMNSGRHNSGRAITSDSNALIFAGEPEPAGRGVLTEQWNGSAWTELADLATAGNKRPGCGTPLLAMCAGNEAPNNGITEEWTVPDAIKTFTAS